MRTNKSIKLLAGLLCASLLCGFAVDGRAATRTWDNDANDYDWYNSINWNPDGAPDDADHLSVFSGSPVANSPVYADANGSITVNGSGAYASFLDELYIGFFTVGTLAIQNGGTVSSYECFIARQMFVGGGSVVVDGAGSEWINSAGLWVGYAGDGTLEILNGASVSSSSATIGYFAVSSGTVTVNGVGSSLDSNTLYVGDYGTGTLDIRNGGSVSSWESYVGREPNSIGTMTVDGAGSSLDSNDLYVGYEGTGTLDIQNGGSVTITSDWAIIGYDPNASGAVTVDGVGSRLDSSPLTVGWRGTGTLEILNGASVSSSIIIGSQWGSSGTMTVDGVGSTLNSNGLVVGGDGTGTLDIQNGGSVSSGNVHIGNGVFSSDSNGTVTVDGAGSSLDCNELVVGFWRTGTLAIQNGGSVSSNTAYIGLLAGPAAVTVDGVGSSLDCNDLLVGGYGTGTLTIENGGSVSSSLAAIGISDISGGTVTVDGAGSAWTNSGDLYIGDANFAGGTGTGTLTVENGGTVAVAGTVKVWGPSSVELLGSDIEAGSFIVDPNGTFIHADGTLTINGGTFDPGASYYIIDGPTPAELPTVKLANGATAPLLVGTVVVGNSNRGALEIQSGGSVPSNFAYIGYDANASGTVTVDGGNSMLEADYFYIGFLGTGTLDIQNGGSVSSVYGYIGYGASSSGTVTVDGAGSSLDTSGLYVGRLGTGTLDIRNGGSVSSDGNAYIAYSAGSIGAATVDGNGSSWTHSGDLYVGGDANSAGGTGTLTVENGGAAAVAGTLKVWGSGSVELLGSDIEAGSLIVDPNATFNHADGTLTINGGTVVPGVSDYAIDGPTPAELPTVKLLSGATASLGGTLIVGNSNRGALEIRSGGSVSTGEVSIAYFATSTGAVTVDGVGSRLNSSWLYVGDQGTGTLAIQSGGSVSTYYASIGGHSTSTGTVTVDGVGSSLDSNGLYVGSGGTGTLNIQNGGSVSSVRGYIGLLINTSSGTVTVDGVGSRLNISGLYVGYSGTGTLDIQNGGSVSTGLASIGGHSTSTGTVTVNGAGSTWTNSGDLYVGGDANSAGGNGTLTVDNGGTAAVAGTLKVWGTGSVELLGSDIEAGSLIVDPNGTFTHADGTLTINGGTFDPGVSDYTIDGPTPAELPTVKLLSGATASLGGTVIVGNSNRGALEIQSGSTVSSGSAYIGFDANSSGTVTVNGNGSTWTNSGDLYVGGDANGHGGSGVVSLANGGTLNVGGTVRIWDTGKLTGHGTVGGDIVSDGVVAPGTFAGTLTIWGDYTQEANGILQIELGGLDANEFDVLDIFGDATLDGTLDVSLIHAFDPNVGDTFVIIDANSVSGTFATESGTDLGDGMVLDVVYGQSDVSLLAILIGDMDASGKVDADDVNPFVLALTDPNAYIAGYSMDPNVVGDCDYSGKLDTDDISPFVALVTGGSPAVPEPAALTMFCGAAAGVLLKRRRKS